MLSQRCEKFVGESAAEEQAALRLGRRTIYQLFFVCQYAEKVAEKKSACIHKTLMASMVNDLR